MGFGINYKGLDGKDFAAYQSLKGTYAYNCFQLHIDQIPQDPYAPPGTGIFRVRVSRAEAGFPDAFFSPIRRVALRDYLARQFHSACKRFCPGRRGTGNSGVITLATPGQEILGRTSIHVDEENIEARLFLGLPASGRRINAEIAQAMLLQEFPRIAESALIAVLPT